VLLSLLLSLLLQHKHDRGRSDSTVTVLVHRSMIPQQTKRGRSQSSRRHGFQSSFFFWTGEGATE